MSAQASFDNDSFARVDVSLLEKAAQELRSISRDDLLVPFPHNCYKLMRSIPGNDRCMDCESHHPDWASVSYGALICMNCSARHRSLGVQFSKVRSLRLDHWSRDQILKMLEGGNEQLQGFFSRHSMTTERNQVGDILTKRYRTKAAKFYREGIDKHIEVIVETGIYRGRGASRRLSKERDQVAAVSS